MDFLCNNDLIIDLTSIALDIKDNYDSELWLHMFILTVYNEFIEPLQNHLKDLEWYKFWHKKFKEQIDDLTTELETYRPTKLSGNGQCKCSKCGCVSWTDFGFSRFKGQILCDKCLNEA